MMKNLLRKLLQPDDVLIEQYFFKDGELIPGAGPTVQKAIYDLIRPALVEAAKKRKEEKKNS